MAKCVSIVGRRISMLMLVLCMALTVSAAEEGMERTNVLKVHFGGGYHLDTYLSPLAYKGWQVGIGNEWWQPFRQDTRLGRTGRMANWAHVGRVDANGFRTLNPARSNLIYGISISGGWGAYYRWKWLNDRLKVFVGPYLEAELTVRNIRTNVNKPLSIDLATDVMAMGGLSWSFYGKKTSYRLSYLVRTNLIGFDMMPDYWQSYYEITQGVQGTMRCSGHWNHHTVKQEVDMDMQLPHTTWRVGVAHNYTQYNTENLQFIRNTLQLIIGCIWNYQIKSNERL